VTTALKLAAFYTIMQGKMMAFSSTTLCMNVPWKVYRLGTRGSVRGIAVREYFAKYFTSTQGSVPWQYGKI